jgi:hypothetical protein
MGTDIHFVVEFRDPEVDNGAWFGVFSSDTLFVHLDHPIHGLLSRDYPFFAALASVRGLAGPEPNGLPDDASALARHSLAAAGGDMHSTCHMSLHEFVSKKLTTPDLVGSTTATKLLGGDPVIDYINMLGIYTTPPDVHGAARVIAWFDN